MSLSGNNISFHRIKMNVNINGHEFELSQPVDDNSDYVEFDISGCFRAMAELYELAPVVDSTSFPVFTTNKITVKDVWVEEGVARDGGHFTASDRSAIMGAYSDYERLHNILTPTFSRKPASPEIVFSGDVVIIPDGSALAPSSTAYKVPASASGSVSLNGRKFYAIPSVRNSYQFQFFNSRGCIESVRAFCIDAQKLKSEKNKITYSRFERFGSFSRTWQKKHVAPSEFTMTSGFVDYEWAQWWAYEFCTASRHWMFYEGTWLPCQISIDDSLTIIERTKVNMCSIQFTVSPDVNGALW